MVEIEEGERCERESGSESRVGGEVVFRRLWGAVCVLGGKVG